LRRGITRKNKPNGRVLEIQKRKRQVIAAAFNEKKQKEARETRLADLSMLLSG
jgi:hypothetical protein